MSNFGAEYFKDKKIISHEVLEEVAQVLPHIKGKTVLDVACGTFSSESLALQGGEEVRWAGKYHFF